MFEALDSQRRDAFCRPGERRAAVVDIDRRLLERNIQDHPERWLRALSRSGLIETTRLTEPDIYWDALIRAGKLGPTNQAVFGMLGFRPVIKCMGGDISVGEKFTYWFKGRWLTENQILQVADSWGWRQRHGNDPYYKKLNRLSFHIRRIEWMYRVALSLLKKNDKRSLDVWLVKREHRTILLSSLIGESWTAT